MLAKMLTGLANVMIQKLFFFFGMEHIVWQDLGHGKTFICSYGYTNNVDNYIHSKSNILLTMVMNLNTNTDTNRHIGCW